MADPPRIGATILLPADDVVAAWEAREALLPSVRWSEVMHEQHATAFTVAKIARLDLLSTMQQSLDRVIREGGTYEQWRDNIVPELRRAGWWGTVRNRDLTGTDEPVIVNERRLRNIYRTNLRMSMAAGQWRKIQREKADRPFLRYLSDHPRRNPRPDHQDWHGLVLPVDDPAWSWLFPPNGWGCGCRVRSYGRLSVRANGWAIGPAPDPPLRDFVTATGRVIRVPDQVDPGFGYNPGIAHLQAIADRAVASVTRAIDAGLDGPAAQTVRELVAGPALEQFFTLPDGVFPLALLTADQAAAIRASNRLVVINTGIHLKQLRHHPDLTPQDYRLLPFLLSAPQHVYQVGREKIIFFRNRESEKTPWWRAIVRQDEGELFPVVVSFHKAKERDRRAAEQQSIAYFESLT